MGFGFGLVLGVGVGVGVGAHLGHDLHDLLRYLCEVAGRQLLELVVDGGVGSHRLLLRVVWPKVVERRVS